MTNIVDARGFSCPQPVLLTIEKIKKVKKVRLQSSLIPIRPGRTYRVLQRARDGRLKVSSSTAQGIEL